MNIPYTADTRPDTGVTNSQLGIWLFLASEVMLFGSLFSAYVLLRTGAETWPDQSSVLNVPLGAVFVRFGALPDAGVLYNPGASRLRGLAGRTEVHTMKKMFWTGAALAVAFGAGFLARDLVPAGAVAHAQAGPRVFELRTYTAHEGKLENVHARFRNHTTRLFQKHGMTNVAYFRPQDAPLSQNTLVYVLAYPSREAAKASWDAFRADPDWQKVVKETQANGPIVANVQSVFMTPTDYSPMK